MFGANQTLASHIGELPSGSAIFHYRLRTVTLNYFLTGFLQRLSSVIYLFRSKPIIPLILSSTTI